MINLYKKYILPILLDSSLKSKLIEKQRMEIVPYTYGTVLEIGFGSGLNLPFYNKIDKLYALEPFNEFYILGKNRIDNAPFIVQHINTSAELIPLPNDSLDSVLSTWTICSVQNPENVLKEIFRVIKPNGKFIFIEHGKSSNKLVFILQRFLTPMHSYFRGGCCLDRDIEGLVLNAGFECERIVKFQREFRPFSYTYKGVFIAKK